MSTTDQRPPRVREVPDKPKPQKKAANSLAAALVELQKELPHIEKSQRAVVKHKDGEGRHTINYADLTDISAQLMPLLAKHGLAFMAKPTLRDGHFVLAYSLLHVSGEREDGEYPLGTGTPQVLGSAITYGRRYCLCAVTGVAPGGSDDDGRLATAAHHEPQEFQNPPISQRQLKALHASFGDLGITDRDAGLAYIADTIGRDVASSKDLTRAEAGRVIDRLRSQLDAAVKADQEAAAAAEDDQPTLPEDGGES